MVRRARRKPTADLAATPPRPSNRGTTVAVAAEASEAAEQPSVVSVDASAASRIEAAMTNAARFDFSGLEAYELNELEELYIDAVWCYHRAGKALLENEDFDKLKAALNERKSTFPSLKRQEIEFAEASIAYYQGKPIVSDEEYKKLKETVKQSGRRKDLASFILYERGNQFLNNSELAKLKEAFRHASQVDFKQLESYPLAELEELYIDALWCYYREGRAILSDAEFDKLKQTLYKLESRFPTLQRQEVAFVEAAVAYYRGEPVVSNEEYEQLKAEVQKSGRRKDVTAFLLYERGEQFLDDEQFTAMKDEYEKLGFAAVNLDQCNVAQLEEMYVDALWAYYHDGVQLLSDGQYEKLKQELEWQGSGFPTLSRIEVDFVKASLAYWRGEPVASDEEWKELKRKVTASGKRQDVTAFLLYSKGKDVLDAETFSQMTEEMAKLGVKVQKAGSKALEQTLSITSDQLENDIGQVSLMVIALATIPTLLSIVLFWSAGLFFDFEFIPQPDWGALVSVEILPLFLAGLVAGLLATWRLFVFLDLQNPEILVGVCPSCGSQVKTFSGGAEPPVEVEYRCKDCGCKMVLDTEERKIKSAGLGAKVGTEDPTFDWSKAWKALKEKSRSKENTWEPVLQGTAARERA